MRSMPQIPTLPGKERLVLELLVSGGPMFGLQLVESSAHRLKRGTVYVTLGRMEQKGYVESEQEPRAAGAIGLPRRMYRATGLGERALRAWTVLAKELSWATER
ncbi:MAG: PadR family transcriptional regulator [Acidobacteria bacterium]|nr:PadR family transcriptional regulator [Acidobacteriota bacterium]